MKSIEELTYVELRDYFLSGRCEYETEEGVRAVEALHNSLTSIEDLIPLLKSNNRSCQSAAVYIAALEGDQACSIFSHITPLLESPWVEVRNEACDCFASCATRAEEFVKLFELFDDSEESIRLQVIQALFSLKYEKMSLVSEYLNSAPHFKDLKIGVSLLLKQMNDSLTYETIEHSVLTERRIVKIFAYIAAFKTLGNVDGLADLVKLSNEPDILKHHEIYFRDE